MSLSKQERLQAIRLADHPEAVKLVDEIDALLDKDFLSKEIYVKTNHRGLVVNIVVEHFRDLGYTVKAGDQMDCRIISVS